MISWPGYYILYLINISCIIICNASLSNTLFVVFAIEGATPSTSAAEGITEGMQGLAVQSLSQESTTELMDFSSMMAAEDNQKLSSKAGMIFCILHFQSISCVVLVVLKLLFNASFPNIIFVVFSVEALTPSSSVAGSMTEDSPELPDFSSLLAAADDPVLPPSKAASPREGQESTIQPPPSYSIIFDNLDFYMPTHHQSQDKSNQSIHWTHHMAVEDRIPTHHLSKKKPTMPVTKSFSEIIEQSLPNHKSQYDMRQEFIVLGARILTQHLAAFKPLSGVVINHIPHQYSENMAKASTHVSAV